MPRLRFTIRSLMIAVAVSALSLPFFRSVWSWLFPAAAASSGLIQCSPCPISPVLQASLKRELAARYLKDAEQVNSRRWAQAYRDGAARLICEAEAIESDPNARDGYAEGDNLYLGRPEDDEDEIRLEPLGP